MNNMSRRSFMKNVAVTAAGVATLGAMTSVPATAAAAPKASGGILQQVLSEQKLTVGCILSFAPFGFKDASDKPAGYDVDMAQALADSLGVSLKIIEVTADARISSLETGKVQAIFGNFTRTLERAQKINFTNPYVVAGERLLVRKDGGIQDVEGLTGRKVGVTKGSTNAELMDLLNPNAEVVYFETSNDALTALKNGQCDCFLEDSNFQAYQASLNDELCVVGDSIITLEYNAIGVAKGDQDWLNYLNLFVFQMATSGKNDELYRKWFGESLPYRLNPEY